MNHFADEQKSEKKINTLKHLTLVNVSFVWE
jgi:hypothetical protein